VRPANVGVRRRAVKRRHTGRGGVGADSANSAFFSAGILSAARKSVLAAGRRGDFAARAAGHGALLRAWAAKGA
jgi:hypothetical protein